MTPTRSPSRRDTLALLIAAPLVIGRSEAFAASGVVSHEDPPGTPSPPPIDRRHPRTNMPLLPGPPRSGPFEPKRGTRRRPRRGGAEGGTEGNPGPTN